MARRKSDKSAVPSPVAEVVERLLARCGLKERRFLFRVQAAWAEVVGERLAGHSHPLRLRGGVLEVRVDQAVWMQHLQLEKIKILRAVNHHFGEPPIRDIFWRFGVLEEAVAEDEAAENLSATAPSDVPAGTDLDPETERLLQSLSDPRLRATFRRLILEARQRG